MTATVIQFSQFAAVPKKAVSNDGDTAIAAPGTLVTFPREYNPPLDLGWIFQEGGALDYWKATGKAYNDTPERPAEVEIVGIAKHTSIRHRRLNLIRRAFRSRR